MIRRMAGLAGGASDTVFNYFGLVKVLHVWFGGRNFARPGSVWSYRIRDGRRAVANRCVVALLCVVALEFGVREALRTFQCLLGSSLAVGRKCHMSRSQTTMTPEPPNSTSPTCSKTTHQPRQCVSSALSIVCHRRHRWALPGKAAVCWPCIGGGLDAATVPDRCISRSLPTPQMMANGACCGTCLCKRIVWKESRTSWCRFVSLRSKFLHKRLASVMIMEQALEDTPVAEDSAWVYLYV